MIAEEDIHPIDKHVGQRIRARRKELRMRQNELAARLSMSSQQMHKYEHGQNRISASKLHEIANALKIPVSYLFAGIEQPAEIPVEDWKPTAREVVELNPLPDDWQAFIELPEAEELMATVPSLSPSQRLSIITVIRAMLERSEG